MFLAGRWICGMGIGVCIKLYPSRLALSDRTDYDSFSSPLCQVSIHLVDQQRGYAHSQFSLVYMSELAHPARRGWLVGHHAIFLVFG